MATVTDHRTLADLLKELRDEARALLHQEVALAKAEISENAKGVFRNSTGIAISALVLFAGFVFILHGLSRSLAVVLLNMEVDPAVVSWAAPLAVGVVTMFVGYLVFRGALATLKEQSLFPEQTVESLKEDKAWARRRVI